jgi:hypothetical protein
MLRLRESKGKIYIEAAIDDDGYIMTNIKCPVHCGMCCTYWKDVVDLAPLVARYPNEPGCPNLRKNGCKFKRRNMPLQCRSHLCALAMLAVDKLVTQDQIVKTVDAGAQNDAFKFLGIEIPSTPGKKGDLKFRGKDEYRLRELIKKREKLCEQKKDNSASTE